MKDFLIALFIFLLGATFATGILYRMVVETPSQDIQETVMEYCEIVGGKTVMDNVQNVFCIPPDIDLKRKE